MSTITDPARELVDICGRLGVASNKPGDQVLAAAFGVDPWSTEFFQIVFIISSKIDEVINLVDHLEMDDDLRSDAKSHITAIKTAFTPNGLQNQWSHAIQNYMSPQNVGPLRMLVPQIRNLRSYPRLDQEEVIEVLEQTRTLIGWLEEHQFAENDFIRQALIDGLRQFSFRLHKAEWTGWGYAMQSLRDVIAAYMALERGTPDKRTAPDANAALKKTMSLVSNIFDKIKVSKEFIETGDFMLRAYGAVALLAQGKQGISGLLTFSES